jgi:tetratricopeptide (TPR) repeat protein
MNRQETPAEFGPAPSQSVNGIGDLGRGDDLLSEGRYEAAISFYKPLSEGTGPLADAVRYRIGLCQESLGRWDEALLQQRDVASRNTSVRIVAAAQLSQARIWVRMGKPTEAKRLLCDLILRSAEPELHDQALLADAFYLLALAMSVEVIHPEPPGPFNEAVVSHKVADWPVDHLLDWVTPRKDEILNLAPPVEEKLVVQRNGAGIGEVRISGLVHEMGVADLIDTLGKQSGLTAEWSEEARHQAAVRTSSLALAKVPLPDVLRALTAPLGLVWRLDGSVIRLVSEEEMLTDSLTSYRVEVAKRTLREAVLAYPDHPFVLWHC